MDGVVSPKGYADPNQEVSCTGVVTVVYCLLLYHDNDELGQESVHAPLYSTRK